MTDDVLRRNIFAIFEVCASYEHLWLKSATTPSRKPLWPIGRLRKTKSFAARKSLDINQSLMNLTE